MKAIELTALDGFDSLRLSEVDKPSPAPGEVLIKVRAAGINYAELEQTTGRYATFSYAFTTPGTFTYVCGIHPFMHGTVVVR
ncbi:hypothetical protein PJN30_12990 [Mycobacterium kansasii]